MPLLHTMPSTEVENNLRGLIYSVLERFVTKGRGVCKVNRDVHVQRKEREDLKQ